MQTPRKFWNNNKKWKISLKFYDDIFNANITYINRKMSK